MTIKTIDTTKINTEMFAALGGYKSAVDCIKAILEAAPAVEPAHGHYYNADDIDRLVRELDVLINGEEGAAPQAKLCDVVAQMRKAKPAPVECEPVLYQYRTKPDWRVADRWSSWAECSKDAFFDFVKKPLVNDWCFQARMLYEQPLDAETRTLALSLCNNVISYEFAGSLDDDAKKLKKLLGAE